MADSKNRALPAGTVLRGEVYTYTIEKVLGQGSFGITYLASTLIKGPLGELPMPVAVKEFFAKDLDSRGEGGTVSARTEDGVAYRYAKAFQRESQNLSKMKHPGIVKVLEAFQTNGTYYYSMEYLPGGSLDDKVKGGGIPEEEALPIIEKIGEALAFMHRHKMMHLDLKPKNIMLKAAGTPVIIDFGLSKQYDEQGEPESSTTIGLGTPGYAPIEQATQTTSGEFQPTLDIYALGATLYKMLTGKTPPAATLVLNKKAALEPELEVKNVSSRTVDAILKAMAPLMDDRPQRVEGFLSMLAGKSVEPEDEPEDETEPKPAPKPMADPMSDTLPVFETVPSSGKPSPKALPRWLWAVLVGIVSILVIIVFLPRKEKIVTVQLPPQATSSAPVTGTANGFIWVDLGRSVKWADRNVGASSPGDFGSYFAWGEVSKKRNYTWENLKYWDASSRKFSKYGPVDGRMELDPSDDAAQAQWGGPWRMPSFEEIQELKEKCIWKWSSQNDRGGYRVTSTVNGASIFLPTPGCRSDNKRFSADSYGYYWSSTLNPDNPEHAMGLFFTHESIGWLDSTRQIGRSVRPVMQ